MPLSVTRTFVKSVDVGLFPDVRRSFQVTRCNQCADAPCVAACPTAAMYQRPDGIVDFDKRVCIGCKACMAACPYDAIFINPEDHSAEKCNLCAHRLDVGLEPACVVVCPIEAILVGDPNDPGTKVAEVLQGDAVSVRRPEKQTGPRLLYRGAHPATLDPLAARRPEGGLFMWSEQPAGGGTVVSGHPRSGASMAAAIVSYDVPHRVPWDWRVSLYTWTKGIAAGAYLAPLVLALAGLLAWSSSLWRLAAPSVALGFLAATGAILIADLEHPLRFPLIFLRPQWRSWLVRGAVVITALALVLALSLVFVAPGWTRPQEWLAIAGAPLGVAAAVYTGYLFAQAKGRDLWQSTLLPLHLLVQAMLLGAAVMLPFARWLAEDAVGAIAWMVCGAALAHLGLVALEARFPHPTAHARLAVHELVRGRFAVVFWLGAVLVAVAAFAPLIGIVAVPFALVGMLAYEHAYVQAGQSVPLA